LVERYCQSGALGSVITVGGSTSVAANNLVLTASNIPPQKSGLFYCATARQSTPFGNGTRCVGTPALRLPIVNSGTATTLTHAVDLAAAPLAPMLPGELWNFQCWFRDGVQFDLSDAVQVLFVP
jgi:hypothetical protein